MSEITNMSDAIHTLRELELELEDASVQIEEKAFDEAEALVDDYIERLQAIKMYCQQQAESSTTATSAVKKDPTTGEDDGEVLRGRPTANSKASGARGGVGGRPPLVSSRRR